MTERIKLVKGDTRPQLKVIVRDETTKEAMDISGATSVRLLFRPAGKETLQATLTGTLMTGLEGEDGEIITDAPYDVAGAGGRVVFPWASGDLDCDPGPYEGEVKVTFSDSTMQTVYETLKFTVRDRFGA